MADLRWENEELVASLGLVEKLEALHGDVRVAAGSVAGVSVLNDAKHAIGGIKWPGARWPGRFAVGTFYSDGRKTKTFAVVHNDTPRAVGVELENAGFDRLIIGCADPEAVVARLERS